ncbi:MAG: hypothetical protein ACD_48C00039G0001 [uncultured bacterium]|nr:MAG: hypothetical protein ACD_48C00039G0001 [uncultured bacterium]
MDIKEKSAIFLASVTTTPSDVVRIRSATATPLNPIK